MERKPIPSVLTGKWDGQSGGTYNLVEGADFMPLAQLKTDAQPEPAEWDFAIHHFDARTHGGYVYETAYISLNALPPSSKAFADALFIADLWSTTQVITDLNEMMSFKVDQFEPGKSHSQYLLDAFCSTTGRVTSNFEVIAATRWDYFSDGRDANLTAKANACYKIGFFTLRGGFRAPTLKEKYMNFDMEGIFDMHGNDQLKAEQSHNLNLSAEYARARYSLTFSGSYSRVHNKIATSSVLYDENNQPYLAYLNVGNLRVWNVEATVQARWNYGLSASIGYNFTHEQPVGSAISQYAPACPTFCTVS